MSVSLLSLTLASMLAPAVSPQGEAPAGGVIEVASAGPFRELRIGTITLTIATTNPLQGTSVDESYLSSNVYSFLLQVGPTLGFEPDIAVQWTQTSPNPSTWDIKLVSNAYFVDPRGCVKDAQGHITDCPVKTQVTADDVKFTFEYVKTNADRTSFFQPCVGHIASVTKVNQFEVTIAFDGPYAPALASLACLPILPKYIWASQPVDWTNALPIGSGPLMARPVGTTFQMVTPPPLLLDRNPAWHGKEVQGRQVYPDTVSFISYTTSSAMLHDLGLGLFDLALESTASDWKYLQLTKSWLGGQVVYGSYVGEQATNVLSDDMRAYFASISSRPLELGHTNPVLRDNWVVRAALHMATNRQRMIDSAFSGLATPADTLLPINHPWHYGVPPYSSDDKNGDGFPFDFEPGFPAAFQATDVTGRGGVPGIPTLLEQFPDDASAPGLARDMLHAAGWLYACATGALDDGAAVPLCRRDASGSPVDRLEFVFSTFNTEPWWETAARGVQEDAAKAGVKLDMQLLNPSQMFNLWYRLDYDGWLWNWVWAPNTDPSLALVVQTCGGIKTLDNDNGYCPRDSNGRWIYDDLYNRTLTESDPAVRRQMTDELQAMIYDFASYNLPFYRGNLYEWNELRWTNWGNWTMAPMLAPDIGNPALLAQFVEPVDQKPPSVRLPGSFEAIVGVPVQFSAAAFDPEGASLTYRWDFDTSSEPGGTGLNGDGIHDNDAQGSGPDPSWTYNTVGARIVSVRVAEASGEWFTVKKANVTVVPPYLAPPSVSAIVYSPTEPAVTDQPMIFAVAAVDPNGGDLYYTWDFGDTPPIGPYPSSPVVSHQYLAAGLYAVRLTVQNALGTTASVTTSILVAPNDPPVVRDVEPLVATVNQATTFVVFASDPNPRDLLTYEWDFGDGTPIVTGDPATHTYVTLASFTLRITVRDSPGGHAVVYSATVVVAGAPGPPRINSLSPSPGSTWTTLSITFTAEASDVQGWPLLWEWDFQSDGIVDRSYQTPATLPLEPVIRQETYLYSTAGTYRATLRITQIPPPPYLARSTALSVTITVVTNHAPTLSSLVLSPESGPIFVGDSVAFSSTAIDVDGDPCRYSWDFGDASGTVSGTTSGFCGSPNAIATAHAFQAAGDYLVTLSVEDMTSGGILKGGRAGTSAMVTVLPLPTIAVEVVASPSIAYPGTLVAISVAARSGGQPLPDANVEVTSAPGGSLSPSSGTTNASGVFTSTLSVFNADDCTKVTVSASVMKPGYAPGSGSAVVSIVYPTTVIPLMYSNRREMMSFETATIRLVISFCGEGLAGANVTTSSPAGGTFGAVSDLGNGTYEFNWTAPNVTRQTFAPINALAKVTGYSTSSRIVILVDPNMTKPGDPTQLFLLVRSPATSLHAGESMTITVYLYTIEGYVVSGANLTVLKVGPGTISAVIDRLNGVYTFVYTAPATISSPTGVLITISSSKYGYASATARVGGTVLP